VSIIFFNLVTLANGFCGTYFAPVNASSVTQTTTPSRFVSDKAQQLLPKLLQISLFLGVLLASRVSGALDPNRLISQYGHTAWHEQDGVINHPTSVAQTHDGYIWVASTNGLLRFDGVTFTPWTPRKGQVLEDSVYELFVTSDGSLWLTTANGLYRLKDGDLYKYATRSGISKVLEDHTGTIWFTRYRILDHEGPFCRITGKDFQCYGKERGVAAAYGLGITEDSVGNIWFGGNVLCRWSSGTCTNFFNDRHFDGANNGIAGVAAGPSGSLWACWDGVGPELGVRYYSNGKWSSYKVPGFDGSTVSAEELYFDHQKTLWVGTMNNGLYRIHDGIADHYGYENGLSGNSAGPFFEDNEGNLWVVTDRGLDLFRDTTIINFSSTEGIFGGAVTSIAALKSGPVWAGGVGALNVIDGNRVSIIDRRNGLPGQFVQTIFEDHAGGVWLGIDSKLYYYEHGRFFEPKKSDGSPLGVIGAAPAIVEDVNNDIWTLVYDPDHEHRRLLRFKNLRLEENIPLDNLTRPTLLAADKKGGIWIAAISPLLAHYNSGNMQTIPLGNDDPLNWRTANLFVTGDNALWLSTLKGLYRWQDGQVEHLDARNGLPCLHIYGVITDNDGDMWLYTRCGVLRIPAADLAAWVKQPGSKVTVRTFDQIDGARSRSGTLIQARVAKSTDGRIWFTNSEMVQVIDPNRIPESNPKPPVYIESVVENHETYSAEPNLRLPPLRGELQIDYTALNYSAPQKIKFRYRLEGHDSDWHDAGSRRQAFYNDLQPGNYRFRVIASNSDGAWNEAGATQDFYIAPMWYQTIVFRIFCVVVFVSLIWIFYRLRLRQVARAMSKSFDERLAERTRIARDLHDTLLQTVQGSKMVAEDALENASDPARLRRAVEQLSVWLDQAVQEGRNALNSLRTSTTERNDLAEALQRASDECIALGQMEVDFEVEGTAKEMHPIVRDEIHRIGYEAIRNACQHSEATRMEVRLRYSHNLRLIVRDNGKGIDPKLIANGKDGHFGLQGMRERAARIGGTFTLVSTTDLGTTIELTVPGGIIFRRSRSV
jgi:signal transduction histidine kinase/ligand-binding sensor domain-containing protein